MRAFLKILKWLGLALLLVVLGLAIWIGPMAYSALHPSHDHESAPPRVPASFPHPAILIFSKTNAFRHSEAIEAANGMFRDLAAKNGWSVYETENGAVHSAEILLRFKVVIWSNASGDVLDDAQRNALRNFIESGGGFIGIHAAGDSSHEGWAWYTSDIIGARFVGHSLWPHLAQANLHIESADSPIVAGLPAIWSRTDEWYSFDSSVRAKGYQVLATIDEASYKRGGPGSDKLTMGKDHPMLWAHCVGKGPVLYSALGHTGESFAEPEMRKLLTNAINWAMSAGQGAGCSLQTAQPK